MRHLLAIALFLAASTARADLVLHKPRHEADFKAVYAALPARGKSVTVHVWEPKPKVWPFGPTVGMYFGSESPEVYVLEQRADRARVTFAHEIGHVVYFHALTQAERLDWEAFWRANPEIQTRDYARSDPAEGFAEAYMATYLPKPSFEARYWGFPTNYKPSPVLTAKVRSYFTEAGK
jgi:hypothetical protein